MKVKLNSRGHITIIDEEDLHFIQDFNWRWNEPKKPSKRYVVRGKRVKQKYRLLFLHREILLWHGWHLPDDMEVDHINHIPYDNRKANLRLCTHSENQANRRSKNKHGYKGVTFNKRTRCYEARIKFGGKYRFLGSYPNARMAAHFYNEAAKSIHGEYAELNDV